ncbi:MAG: 30S ribosomal protein S4 [Parcubacteria group bacterium]
MARDLNPKCKQCRREGVKLFLKGDRCFGSKCAIVKRNFIPGMHGEKQGRGGSGRMTGYGMQLREKQKAKRTYRILERQFRNYFKKAVRRKGDTRSILFSLLEKRLDNAVYRAGFAANRDQARQLVNHGHFTVNGKKVTIPSFQVDIKDKIGIRPSSLAKMESFKTLGERLKGKEIPEWLAVEPKELTAVVVGEPSLEKNRPNFDLKQITEFYSR